MRKNHWEPIFLELSRPMTAYLLWLVARDLGQWGSDRRSRLTREEVCGLAHFLSDFLPDSMRTPLRQPEPILRVS